MSENRISEIIATISVLASFVFIPVGIVKYHRDYVLAGGEGITKVISLTGVAKDGVWTLDDVNAHNYWRKTFSRATLYLNEGDHIKLRINSADAHHRFYAPALNIGPVDVETGHTKEVSFRVGVAPGKYRYYCTSICGDCHFTMQGWIVVLAKGVEPDGLPPIECFHNLKLKKPPKDDMIAWGGYLYKKLGCETCHGIDGTGKVENFNYVKKSIPDQVTLASRLFLHEEEDAEEFIGLITSGADLDKAKETTEIPKYPLILVQYKAAKEMMSKGKVTAKLDPKGPQPPLSMPSWKEKLSDKDMDAVLAYLLSLYPWEEEEY